jgi:hypothetical protein
MMNPMIALRSTLGNPAACRSSLRRLQHLPTATTTTRPLAMKAGSAIPGLDVFQEKEPPVVLERSEYPDWINTLAVPLVSLAKLRKMPDEEATLADQKRYFKLLRRIQIKEKNEEAKAG